MSRMPLPALWSFLFFMMLFILGISSQFGLAEVMITAIYDQSVFNTLKVIPKTFLQISWCSPLSWSLGHLRLLGTFPGRSHHEHQGFRLFRNLQICHFLVGHFLLQHLQRLLRLLLPDVDAHSRDCASHLHLWIAQLFA